MTKVFSIKQAGVSTRLAADDSVWKEVNDDMHRSIAIDGPCGAGKSSVAGDLAAREGLLHLDTGAMYRAFAWHAMNVGVDTQDEKALTELTTRTSVGIHFVDGRQRTLVNGQDVTELIRVPEVGMGASNCSKFAHVRAWMVGMQRELAMKHSMVLDGRDIGTKVLPHATLKIFLTASPQIRASRRWKELRAKGVEDSYEEVLTDILRRDQQDTTRKVDPLRAAEDAVIIDTSDMTQKEAVDAIVKLLHQQEER